MSLRIQTALVLLVATAATAADAQQREPGASPGSAKFDGTWNLTLNCLVHKEDVGAKGYTHRFPAEVKNGQFRGVHGEEGQPGWHLLQGAIAEGGSSAMTLDGVVNNADYAVNHSQRGKLYSYRVGAQFGPVSGTGQRIGKRSCDFRFARQ